jgi:transaldolase/glucose-6-phosphate isomerase
MNPLKALQNHGQSVWLDYVHRDLLQGGGLERLIEEDGVVGVTSNPSIFEKAIGEGTSYDESLRRHVESNGHDALAIYERLAIEDIQRAADILRPVYDRTQGRDGFISLEVSPFLALKTEETVAEARRLWRAVERPNLMIKVPGTEAGVPAIRRLIADGINVNITLLFARSAYSAVAEAYLDGLDSYAAKGDPSRLASVASFFVSRIDTALDRKIDERLKQASGNEAMMLQNLRGKVAIANAKLAYVHYRELVASDRWQRLAARGARPQRLLWASTGTKNKAYSDVLYVEELIGPDTVNTMPVATMDAFRDHGKVRDSLTEGIEEARGTLAEVERLGLDLASTTTELVSEGVQLFADAADKLLAAVERKRAAILGPRLNRLGWSPAVQQPAVEAALKEWQAGGKVRRLWARDASLWTGGDEAKWLGWLGAVNDQLAELRSLEGFQADIRRANFSDVLLIGMGGSSLGPEVLARSFGSRPGYPSLHVLDSTDPAEIRACAERLDLPRTLVIVASKSGSTLEPNILKQYFFQRMVGAVGIETAGSHFIALTDPGSKLQQAAIQDRFRQIFFGVPAIGGRYSVLSHFGTVPAAAMGLDVGRFLRDTQEMVRACKPAVPPPSNPGATLGCILGAHALHGRDKLTLIASPGIADIGAWLEQLIAESTGKQGKAIIPVEGEPPGDPGVYGADRLFAYLRLDEEPDAAQDAAVAALEAAGQPVVRVGLAARHLLGQEFFRWQIGVAVAGSILGINPFDQPDVEASKVKTRALMEEYERVGRLPADSPILQDQGIALFTDGVNADALARAASARTLDAYIAAHVGRLGAGDYAAILAYIERKPPHVAQLTDTRRRLRDGKHVATCLGFGPRFLHSTGQAYKGGPNSGVFLQITCDDVVDIPVPGAKYSFGAVKTAQARGDFAVLAERGRRALRVHLGPDVEDGLARLDLAIERALG